MRARDEEWPSQALKRARRGSGPNVERLKAEIDKKDELFEATAKAVPKAWKQVGG